MDSDRIEYSRSDEKLKKRVIRASQLLQKYHSIDYENQSLKIEVLQELLGSFGDGIVIEANFHCDLGDNIHLGKNFYAGFNCTILDIAEVRIGDNCLIAPNVGLYTAGHSIHPVNRHKTGYGKPIRIGNNVWIGGHSVVLGGVSIGDNSVIAAGSVLTKSVPKNEVYAGNPARKIKEIPE